MTSSSVYKGNALRVASLLRILNSGSFNNRVFRYFIGLFNDGKIYFSDSRLPDGCIPKFVKQEYCDPLMNV